MRAGWVLAAVVACAACGKDAGDKGKAAPPAAPKSSFDAKEVKRFKDDWDHPLVGVGPEAPAEKALAAVKAALAEEAEIGFVELEPPPGGGPVAPRGEAGHKGYVPICKLKAPPPPYKPESIEEPPPTLSVLVTHDRVWFLVSRIKDNYMIDVTPDLMDSVNKLAAQLASEPWFATDRPTELALEGGVSGATLIAVIHGLCPEFAAFRIVAPEALTTRPEL